MVGGAVAVLYVRRFHGLNCCNISEAQREEKLSNVLLLSALISQPQAATWTVPLTGGRRHFHASCQLLGSKVVTERRAANAHVGSDGAAEERGEGKARTNQNQRQQRI